MRLGATGALGMWGLEKYGVQAIRRSGPLSMKLKAESDPCFRVQQ